ncbi:15848_t:CDS:2, partial [Gigaspora margarita]
MKDKTSEIFEWQQVNPKRLEKIIRIQEEQEDKVALDTNQIRQIAKKITITLNEGGITDYGMEEMEQQVFNALESSLKSGEIGTETLVYQENNEQAAGPEASVREFDTRITLPPKKCKRSTNCKTQATSSTPIVKTLPNTQQFKEEVPMEEPVYRNEELTPSQLMTLWNIPFSYRELEEGRGKHQSSQPIADYSKGIITGPKQKANSLTKVSQFKSWERGLTLAEHPRAYEVNSRKMVKTEPQDSKGKGQEIKAVADVKGKGNCDRDLILIEILERLKRLEESNRGPSIE